jgi:hypothetical protein
MLGVLKSRGKTASLESAEHRSRRTLRHKQRGLPVPVGGSEVFVSSPIPTGDQAQVKTVSAVLTAPYQRLMGLLRDGGSEDGASIWGSL